MLKEKTDLVCNALRTIPLGYLYDPKYGFEETYLEWRKVLEESKKSI